MALRALVGKLRVLPPRAAASRSFASQMVGIRLNSSGLGENEVISLPSLPFPGEECSKCALEEQDGDIFQRMDEAMQRDLEELTRYRRTYVVNFLVLAGGVGFAAFSLLCVADALADDSY